MTKVYSYVFNSFILIMNHQTIKKVVLLAIVVTILVVVFANYIDESPSHQVFRSAAEVMKDAKDDDVAQLTGNIVERISKERFIFRDATGEIQVTIDQEKMPTQTFDEKTVFEISGEVELVSKGSVEIDVDSIKVVK
ncbi:YgiW/YdeI family stress tolerance OB fold protein [Limnohabitans sp.]|uniref:YgiW/YdeI family stress tolerance OB fold protein n=2 Tax=Limnohabitans sp. TaxID=1907725 RepID=UPI003918881F